MTREMLLLLETIREERSPRRTLQLIDLAVRINTPHAAIAHALKDGLFSTEMNHGQ